MVGAQREHDPEPAAWPNTAEGVTTSVAALENGKVRTFEVTPEDAGLTRVKPEMLGWLPPKETECSADPLH